MSNFSFDSPPPLHVRLYGRAGCSKCNEAGQLLASMRGDFDFWIERVDIDSDLAIREKLNDHIPVITFNGAHRVQMPVTEEKVRRAFKKALQVEAKDQSSIGAQAVEMVQTSEMAHATAA